MAITERYVDASAAGGGDGTTAATSGANGAFTWAEMITDINTPRVGYRYNVKQGTYSLSATTTLTGDGTTTSPNIIRGYKTTIGDATLLRTTGGVVDTSNMPTIAYGSTYRFAANGATNLIVESLNITSTVAGSTIRLGTESLAVNCKIDNASTSSSAYAFEGDAVSTQIVNCDAILSAGVAGSKAISTAGPVSYCLVSGGGGNGIELANNATSIVHNTVYDSAIGIRTLNTTARAEILSNTIVNCTGDGIDIVTATTAQIRITGNHITGCGGYGIDFNTSTCPKILINNRFRDNTSGNVNGGGDYETATSILNQTADDTDALDFTDHTTDDYSLKSTAAGYHTGLGWYQNIGANGTPVATGGGGGSLLLGGLGQTGIGSF
jgi:hypothetical protein